MLFALLTAALLAGQQIRLTPAATVLVHNGVIRIDDVVISGRGHSALGQTIIARMRPPASSVIISRLDLATLVRRSVPGLRLPEPQPGSIGFHSVISAPPPEHLCARMVTAVQAGSAVWAGHTELVPCVMTRSAGLSFDRNRKAIALRDLASGDILGPVVLQSKPAVVQAARLVFRTVIGPATIERRVIALQPSNGARLFVKGGDGDVFVADVRSLSAGSAPQ